MRRGICEKCGNSIATGDSFCNSCGTSALTPIDRQMPALFQFFTVWNLYGIFSGLGMIIYESFFVHALITHRSGVYIFVGYIGMLLLLCAFAGLVLLLLSSIHAFRRKIYFLQYVQAGQLLLIVFFLFTIFQFSLIGLVRLQDLLLYIRHPGPGGPIALVALPHFISNLIRFFLVPIYYSKSARVRAYMGSDAYLKKAILVLGKS